MSQVQQLLESSAGSWKNLQSDAARLAGKWARTGLLEGLNEVEKNNISMLLENQAKQLVVETNTISTNSGFTSGTQGENWAGIALPLVRKVFGTIVAKEFVSVQPMNMPSGLVFFLDFQYGNSKNPFTAGDSLYGDRNASGRFPFATPAAEGGLYNPSNKFTYSTNQTSSVVSAAVATASWAELNFDSTYSASAAAGTVKKFTVATATTLLPNFDADAVRGFTLLSGSAATVDKLLPQFTTYNYTGNTVAFFFTASTAETNGTASIC
jgi:hypothetical protein